MCYIELYFSNHFTRQFSYNQLYIDNPSKAVAYQGNLFEGARGWFYLIAGSTGVEFTLPRKSTILIPCSTSAHHTW